MKVNKILSHIAMWVSCFSCSIPPPPPPPPPSPPPPLQHHQQRNIINTTSSKHHLRHKQHNTINTTPSTQHHLHDTINKAPSTQHHQRISINTAPSTRHHLHNTINTTPSTQHLPQYTIYTTSSKTTSSTQHLHNIINTTPSTLHHQKQHHQHNIINTTPSSPQKSSDDWVLWAPAAFAWQVQHSEHLSPIWLGRCSTRSTSREVRGSPATIEYYGRRLLLRGRCSTRGTSREVCRSDGRRLLLRGRCNTWSSSVSFWVAGAALGASQSHLAWQVQHSEHLQRGPKKSGDDWVCFLRGTCSAWRPQSHFAWQVQHSEHLSVISRGRCSTRSTSREVRGSLAPAAFAAGAALGGPQSHFAWQVQHPEHLQRGPRKSSDDWVLWAPAAFARQVQHSEDLSLILRGRCSTRSISVSSGVALGAPPERSAEVWRRLSLLLRGTCSAWRTSASFCVAGAALGASQCHFAAQVQHSMRKSIRRAVERYPWITFQIFRFCSTFAAWAAAVLHHQAPKK